MPDINKVEGDAPYGVSLFAYFVLLPDTAENSLLGPMFADHSILSMHGLFDLLICLPPFLAGNSCLGRHAASSWACTAQGFDFCLQLLSQVNEAN